MAATLYTSGIRKIYDSGITGEGLAKCCAAADGAGFKAMNFNGVILVRTAAGWEATTFKVEDFEVIFK